MSEVLSSERQFDLVAEVAFAAQRAAQVIVDLSTRPHVLMRPKVYPDGDRWCALYGDDLQSGVCGFGASPEKACEAFDVVWSATGNAPKEGR